MLDLTWITETVAVGGAPLPEYVETLNTVHGVRRVVDVRGGRGPTDDRLRTFGIETLLLPTPDFGAVPPEMLEEGVRWIQSAVAAGERVLVHCQLGIGRSVLVVLCYLVAGGLDAPTAMRLVKSLRPQANPSPAQIDALLAWEERVTGTRSSLMDVLVHAR